MKKLSQSKRVMINASEKGYIIDKTGNVSINEIPRKVCITKDGYKSFTIRFDDNGTTICRRVWVHRLQAYQKYGKAMFKKGIQVRHLNGNSSDNTYDNILIGTPSENQMDKSKEKRIKQAINASSKNRILTNEQIIELKKDRELNKMSYPKIMTKYNISSKGTLSFIINKSTFYKEANIEK